MTSALSANAAGWPARTGSTRCLPIASQSLTCARQFVLSYKPCFAISDLPPSSEASVSDPIPFEPVKLRPRHDGWTAERQGRFIPALAESGCVQEAGRRIEEVPVTLVATADYRRNVTPNHSPAESGASAKVTKWKKWKTPRIDPLTVTVRLSQRKAAAH